MDQKQKQCSSDNLHLISAQAKADCQASEKLAKDLNDLNQVMTDLAKLVQSQGETADSIEEHVERTTHEIHTAHDQLRKAVNAKTAQYPLVAAVIGSVAIGGPVGITAGSVITGVAAAVGGAFAGLCSGRAFKRQIVSPNSRASTPDSKNRKSKDRKAA